MKRAESLKWPLLQPSNFKPQQQDQINPGSLGVWDNNKIGVQEQNSKPASKPSAGNVNSLYRKP